MGPSTHAVDNPIVGEMNFPNAILHEIYDEWQILWYEACLLGSKDMAELDALPAVTYFTMGAVGEENAPGNEWHTTETWPPDGFEEMRIYLQPDFTLGIQAPDENGSGDTFVYNPNDPSPTICGANLMIDAGLATSDSLRSARM